MGYLCVKHQPSNWTEEETDSVSAAMKQEEEILTNESGDASSQWVKQMRKASDASMPFKHKVVNLIVALLATTLAIVASYAPTAADSPAPQLQ